MNSFSGVELYYCDAEKIIMEIKRFDFESPDYKNGMSAYNSRKNHLCIKTALIEPVSTREKYRHKGIGKAMMHGGMIKCRELGIEKCYVNSYDWRRKFYNAAGFTTEHSIGFYHKRLEAEAKDQKK